jgi:hypothetical protein
MSHSRKYNASANQCGNPNSVWKGASIVLTHTNDHKNISGGIIILPLVLDIGGNTKQYREKLLNTMQLESEMGKISLPEDEISTLDVPTISLETGGNIQNWGVWEVKYSERRVWGRAVFPVDKLYVILIVIDPKEQLSSISEQTFVEIQKDYLKTEIDIISHFTVIPLILIVLRSGESSTPVDELVQYEPQQVHHVLFYNIHDMENLLSDLSTVLNR